MRASYRSSSTYSYSFGPGPLTPAIKALVVANVAAFLVSMVVPAITLSFGLRPADVLESLQIWQPVTYMFLHGGIFHILFNMLALWMFGVELERMWGSRFFTRFYFVVGVGAAFTTLVLSFMPLPFADQLYYSLTIGASGAVYGVLLAYAMYFPHRPIYVYFFFPIPAKYFVMIIGAISLLVGDERTGRRHRAHDAPRRPDRRLSVPEGRLTHAPAGGNQVSVPEMAHQPDASTVRRLRGRPQ